MKKAFWVLFLLCFLPVYAQDTIRKTYIEDGSEQFKLFIGAGATFVDNMTMNKFLKANGIVPLETTEFNFTVGLEFFNKNLDIDLGYELQLNGQSDDLTKNRTISNGIKLRAHYELFHYKKTWLSAGFNLGYSKRKLTLIWKDYAVDFNDLPAQETQGNQLTLFLERATLGPSVSVKFKESGNNYQQTKITFAYEFGINNKIWETDFFQLETQIKETKMAQFLVNVTFNF